MNRRSTVLRACLALSVALASGACVAVLAPPSAAQERMSGGMEAYFDPTTGRLVVPPAGRIEKDAGARAAAEIDVDAAETSSPVVGGGVMMDVRGRAKAALTGHITAGGKSVAECAPEGSDTAVQP